jgi:hypothetical protein
MIATVLTLKVLFFAENNPGKAVGHYSKGMDQAFQIAVGIIRKLLHEGR